MSFKIGDVVTLKSGGPDMTISMVLTNKFLRCQWFVDFQLQSDDFHPDTLEFDE